MSENGNRIAEVLAERERSGSWLARQIGVHQTVMSRWIRGAQPVPADRQREIAKVLRVARSRLFPRLERVR